MDPRTRRWLALMAGVVLAGCSGAGRGSDHGVLVDDGARPDIPYQISETYPGWDLGGPDDPGKTADDRGGEDGRFDARPDTATDAPGDAEAADAGDEVPGSDAGGDAAEDDAGWNCETDGNWCDDGDPCTTDDRCQGGECIGKPLLCKDDGIPCTTEACEGGACIYPVKPAYCLIANKCYKDGDVSLANSCLYCNAAGDPRDWTPATGWMCSDADPCTVGDTCQNGVCKSGVNECVPPDCTYHADCYPERICGPWYKDGKTHCSLPCASPADCGTGEVCTHLPGSAGVGYCQVGPLSGGEFGTLCQTGSQCASVLCVEGVCGHFCGGQSACAAGATCFPAGDGTDSVQGACAPNSVYPTGRPFGLPCTNDGGKTYDSSLCLSGHCDLMMTSQPQCTPLCVADSQCGSGQECNVVLYSTKAVANSVPFAPEFTARTHDGVLGCYSVGTGGYKAVGQTCSTPQECKTNKCFALKPGDPTKHCTTFCGSDVHCPAGWQCKPELLTLTNEWLKQPFSQPPKSDGYTLVRLCKPK